ncbi:MAG: hypothetical protein WCJ30_11480, partial [Deltaproteobacteria bacterium]
MSNTNAGSMRVRFQREFARWSGVVRTRLSARWALHGATWGLIVAVPAAALAWALRHPGLRAPAAIIGVLGALGGWVVARRKRWSDHDVALFLDARLDHDEAISTAVSLDTRESDPPPPAFEMVLDHATRALEQGDRKKLRVRVLQRFHAALPFAVAALIVFARLPERRAPVPTRAPGTQIVRMADVRGLEMVTHVDELPARDPAQRERLARIAEDARRLREQLRQGMSQRDALDRIARLRERLSAEQTLFSSNEQRRGLEAAISRLASGGLRDAARALGDHDLQSLDHAMERQANAQERSDRQRARQALEEAANAAQREGADEVARALHEQQERMTQREARNGVLRDVAQEMAGNADVQRALERLNREGTDAAARDLAQAQASAIQRMSDAERQALADRLRQRSGAAGAQA